MSILIHFPFSSGEEQNKEALQDVEDETQQWDFTANSLSLSPSYYLPCLPR